MRFIMWGTLVAVLWLAAVLPSTSQSMNLEREPACQTLRPAATGGPVPTNPDVLLLRYLGRANYEIAYRGKVLLLDAYYDNSRLPFGTRFGLTESEVTRADAIFVGHTHFDHFGDASPIAKRTGAPVFVGPRAVPFLLTHGVPENQIRLVRGQEDFKLDGYRVQTALAIHMPIVGPEGAAFHDLIAKADPLTDTERAQRDQWRSGGQSDGTRMHLEEDPLDPEQDTLEHGTFVYVITFDDGFRLVYSDTAGVLSGGERVLAETIHASGGKVNLAILGYLQIGYNLHKAIKVTARRAQVWDPSILLPSHFHDGEKSELPEMPTAPLFEALRDQAPEIRPIEPLFRTPVCVNTKTNDFFVGYYAR